MPRLHRAVSIWALLCLAPIHAAHAARCQEFPGAAPSLAEADAAARLHFLQGGLRRAARPARVWAWGFGGLYAALTGLQLAVTPAATDEDRRDLYLGAAASSIGVLTLLAMPLPVMRDQRWLDARIARASPGEDPCALLADAERLLVRDAAKEEFGKSPLIHAGNLVFNMGLGLLYGFAFGHWEKGAMNLFIGAAVGEVMIVLQPTESVALLRRYRAGDLGAPPAAPRASFWVAPSVGRDAFALTLVGAF